MSRLIKGKTQDFLEVEDVIADLLVTKNGTFCVIIKTNAVNFELLSPEEQNFKIQAFAQFMNSLDFDLQIVIETQHVSLHKYADFIDKLENPNLNEGLQRQFKIYKKFIRNLATSQNILDKKFFLIIPYRSGASYHMGMKESQRKLLVEQALNFLIPKRNHVIKMLKAMGLTGTQLNTADIVKYFYKIYNPKQTQIKFDETSITL